MSQSNTHEQNEAKSASLHAKSAANTSKNHSGGTGKTHTFRIHGCTLKEITIQCAHVKNKSEKTSHDKSDSPTEHKPAGTHGHTGSDAPGSRIVKVPEAGAKGNTHSDHVSPQDTKKTFLMVVPSGRTITEPHHISLLKGAIVCDLNHASGYAKTGDKVTFSCQIEDKCTKHPFWTITDRGTQVATVIGPELVYEFLPPVPEAKLLQRVFNAWWLKDIEPRSYEVICKTCKLGHGLEEAQTMTVLVYPNMKSSAELSFGMPEEEKTKAHQRQGHSLSELMDQLLNGMYMIKEEFDVDPTEFIEWPRGKIAIDNGWAEDEKSHYAYWGGSLKVGLDPVIGVKFRVTLVPALAMLKIVPPSVKKYAKVDVYLEVTGGLKMTTDFNWKFTPDKKVHITGDLTKTIGGDIGLELGADVFVGKKKPTSDEDSLIYGTLHANTSFGADGGLKFTDEAEIELEAQVSWGGVSVTAKLAFWHGKIHTERKFEVVKGGTAKTPPLVLFKRENAAEGA